MAKQQPPTLAAHSGKCCSTATGRKGQYTQINNNGIGLENIQCGLHATAVDSTTYAKEVVTCQATKAAEKTDGR
eukprot:5341455-Ditylum_brightwellii.AAC.1